MDLFTAMDVSASGLFAQRVRMNVISMNLANAQTTRTVEGGPYRRRDVVMSAVGSGFQARNPLFPYIPAPDTFREALKTALGGNEIRKVEVVDIVEDPRDPKLVYDPSHPDANRDGYVLMPNINTMEEMVNLIATTRNYEANLTAINATKTMAQRTLQLGQP
ncbi:MAG: flagellar basal body rod protein FlgC [Nitrospirae bacterium]|nr:flagellar basal body rod protein FlgC [Nitrospirota bacterium]